MYPIFLLQMDVLLMAHELVYNMKTFNLQIFPYVNIYYVKNKLKQIYPENLNELSD